MLLSFVNFCITNLYVIQLDNAFEVGGGLHKVKNKRILWICWNVKYYRELINFAPPKLAWPPMSTILSTVN